MSIRWIAPDTPEYRAAYRRGWDTGQRGADGALDRADRRGEPHAWYDGYMDAATGRERWHMITCTDADCLANHGNPRRPEEYGVRATAAVTS